MQTALHVGRILYSRLKLGSPQVGRTAGAQYALVSCSAPAPTPASNHRMHCLHFRAATLLPVPHHPAVRCRPVQMGLQKPAAMFPSRQYSNTLVRQHDASIVNTANCIPCNPYCMPTGPLAGPGSTSWPLCLMQVLPHPKPCLRAYSCTAESCHLGLKQLRPCQLSSRVSWGLSWDASDKSAQGK